MLLKMQYKRMIEHRPEGRPEEDSPCMAAMRILQWSLSRRALCPLKGTARLGMKKGVVCLERGNRAGRHVEKASQMQSQVVYLEGFCGSMIKPTI